MTPSIKKIVSCGLFCWTLASAPPSSVAQATAVSLPAAPPKETRIFPLAEVHRGQRGVAYTVFEGVLPEPMEVEILGLLKDSLGPGRDMILARLHGTKPEYTGVVAGMSGSPVYIDGRLAGALSYRIGQFSKEPIAGITPIEEMLDVRDAPTPRAAAKPMDTSGPVQAMETPLLFSGFSQETLDLFGDRARALGLMPVAGLGGTDASTPQPEPLIPGSAVSAILVRGDLSIAGTCTVTYVDPKRLLACGHPITQNGPVSMPMTKANVVATLASPLNAFKIVNTTETVGSFTEDRASAILGRFDLPARMIPVSVEVTGTARPRTFHFEVLDDRQLTPFAMLSSVYQTLQGTNAAAAEQSYLLAGELSIAHEPPIHLRGMMAPGAAATGAIAAALYVNESFSRVYENAAEQPVVTGLHLNLTAEPGRKSAILDSARTSSLEARAGETIEIEATLRPFQAEPVVVRFPVTLPARLAPGVLRLLVGDNTSLDRLAAPPAGLHSVSLADTVASLNHAHANDRLYATVLDHSAQAALGAGALPGIPLSMANVLDPLKNDQQMQLTGESAVEIGSAATPYALTGSRVVRLVIK